MHINALFGPVIETGIGIDIDHSAIQIIQLGQLHGCRTLINAIKIPTPADTISDSFALPQTSTRIVDTALRVTDGDQIASGGPARSEAFLSRLPVIAAPFQSDSKQRCNSDVIMPLTARQLKD